MTATEFSQLIQACAIAPTRAERQAADRALTLEELERLEASGYRLPAGVDPFQALNGGVWRAGTHASWGRLCSGFAFGSGGGLIGVVHDPRRPVVHPRVALPTRVWSADGWAEANANFGLEPVDEVQVSSLVLVTGVWHIRFSGRIDWASPPTGPFGVGIAVDGVVIDSRTAEFGTPIDFAVEHALAAPGVVTLRNVGTVAQIVHGVLIATPEA